MGGVFGGGAGGPEAWGPGGSRSPQVHQHMASGAGLPTPLAYRAEGALTQIPWLTACVRSQAAPAAECKPETIRDLGSDSLGRRPNTEITERLLGRDAGPGAEGSGTRESAGELRQGGRWGRRRRQQCRKRGARPAGEAAWPVWAGLACMGGELEASAAGR